MSKYALFIYHRWESDPVRWEYRRDIETGSPAIWLEQLFEKVYAYKVKGGMCINAQVIINGTKFKCLHVVYGGGYEMYLAKR